MGGWAALAGAICLGPRLGKYTKEGKPTAIPGHNIPLATLGVFILWFGWFGFNPGSTTAANTSTALIAVNTNLAAAAGAVFAMITAWVKFGKPEVGMTLNGTLAGLVAITAGCANLTPAFAVLTGAIAGVLVVVAVLVIDRIGVDDPVGAISVHGLNGAWGTLAAGLFNADKMFDAHIVGVQVIGILACFAWSFTLCFLLFKLMQKTIGLRVAPEEEYEGLDFHEHGGDAYPEFGHTAGTSLGSLPGRLESGADPPTARGASLLGMV